jgi:hypothetical protein
MEANPMDQQKSQQTKQAALDSARISALVRTGAMSSSELPRLKLALRRHAQVGDIAKLPKQHRDVLTKYYDATSSAAIGSQQAFQAVRKNLMQHNEIEGEEVLTEAIAGFKDENNPPMVIVLQRKGIRIFPDGKKVAMYNNKQLGLVITIPYAGTGNSPGEIIPGTNVQMEEVEGIMESLDQVAAYAQEEQPKAMAKHMKFADGSKLKVSHGAAKAIHMVHGALNDENKKKFADMLTHPKGFEKAAHFALSKVSFKIGNDK